MLDATMPRQLSQVAAPLVAGSADLFPADLGDAPDTAAGTGYGNYQTTDADGGPLHRIVPGLHLGANVDADSGDLQNATATADDVDGSLPDDEDGVLNPLELLGTEGAAPTVTLLVTNTTGAAAMLYGWIDYNGDGSFDDVTERAQIEVSDGTLRGRFTLTFPVIPAGSRGQTYARFRLSTDAGAASSVGYADDGEVEDYSFAITAPSEGIVSGYVELGSGLNGLPELPSLANRGEFGGAVTNLGDLDGDGIADLAVGAPGDSATGTWQGAVYILFLNGDGSVKSYTQIGSELNGGPPLSYSARFGSSVASLGDLDGDGVTELAVGAINDDTGDVLGAASGMVHVLFLNRDGTVRTSTSIGNDLNGGPSLAGQCRFGMSVANVGDLNGDGITDLAVGADRDSQGGRYRGAVYVLLLKSDGHVLSSTKIAHETGGGPTLKNSDQFGAAVANLGDIDGDGITDLAVGADLDDTDSPFPPFLGNEGAVHILFLNEDQTVRATRKITLGRFDARSGGFFGTSLAGVGDLNGDGVPDMVVGSSESSFYGSAYVMLLNGDGTIQRSTQITNEKNGGPPLELSDSFGISVASMGDLNGDGAVELAIGASHAHGSGDNPGGVYILKLDEFEVLPASLNLPGPGSYDVWRDGDELVVSVTGGSSQEDELFRQRADAISELTITGSSYGEIVAVKGYGSVVSTPITFLGRGGDDLFDGTLATGPLVLVGNSGNDTLIGGVGDDTLRGGANEDELSGGGGNDVVKGQGGNGDRISGAEGDDVLHGGRGRDRLVESGDVDFVLTAKSLTGLGNDRVAGFETAELNGGVGNNRIDASAFPGRVRIDGRRGHDFLIGSAFRDTILGNRGNDTIQGREGNDFLHGGSGNDRITGHDGIDLILGRRGDDIIYGGIGNDVLFGGDGSDTLIGGNGNDVLGGGAKQDTITKGTGNSDPSPGDVVNDRIAIIDETFRLHPLPDWVDQV
jgi:hypothetical protein